MNHTRATTRPPAPDEWPHTPPCSTPEGVEAFDAFYDSGPNAKGRRRLAQRCRTYCQPCPVMSHCRTWVDWVETTKDDAIFDYKPVAAGFWAGETPTQRLNRRTAKKNRPAGGARSHRHVTTIPINIGKQHWLTANARHHWAVKAERTRYLKQAAYYTARNMLNDRLIKAHTTPVDADIAIAYPTARKADPANAAPTVKALIDGLVAVGLIADDDSKHLPAITYRRDPKKAPKGTYTITITLTPTEEG